MRHGAHSVHDPVGRCAPGGPARAGAGEVRALRLAALLVALACASPDEERTAGRAEVGAASPGPTVAPPSPSPPETVEARHLTWDVAAVERRLRAVGLEPVRRGEVRQPFLDVPGALLEVGGAEVQAFVYGDVIARARDTDGLDTTRVSPPTDMVTWREPASLVTKGNLAAVVLTRDEALRARIRRALVADDEPVRSEP